MRRRDGRATAGAVPPAHAEGRAFAACNRAPPRPYAAHMPLAAALLLCSLTAQAPHGPVTPIKLEPPGRPRAHLRWDQPVQCTATPPTHKAPSGELRVQCDDEQRVCLVAPDRELDRDGVETSQRLTRTRSCDDTSIDWSERSQRGWRFVPAVAEAPPGWYRDERGRVMQFNFDLNRRVYLGGAWSPLWLRSEDTFRSTYRAEFGIQMEFDEDDMLGRIHLLEGEFILPDDSATFTAFRYDWSHQQTRPSFTVTTFVGKPRRFALNLNLGGYLEALQYETIRRGGQTESQLMIANAQPTFDLWHSKDLVSYVRVRVGPGLALDTVRKELRFAGQGAFEGDFTVDTNGFHHVRFGAEGEQLFFTDVPGRDVPPQRLRLKAEYEVVLLAINDQPLSLVLDGRGSWRNDIEGYPVGWEWSAGAGLRFSLWAPARRNAP